MACEWIAPRERLCVRFPGCQSPDVHRRRLFSGGAVATWRACSSASPQTVGPISAATNCSFAGTAQSSNGQLITTTLSQIRAAPCWPDDDSHPLVDLASGARPPASALCSKVLRQRRTRHRALAPWWLDRLREPRSEGLRHGERTECWIYLTDSRVLIEFQDGEGFWPPTVGSSALSAAGRSRTPGTARYGQKPACGP